MDIEKYIKNALRYYNRNNLQQYLITPEECIYISAELARLARAAGLIELADKTMARSNKLRDLLLKKDFTAFCDELWLGGV